MNKLAYQQWFTKKDLSAGTQRTYKPAIEQYMNFTNKNLDELIEEAEKEEIECIRPRKRKINAYIISFKAKLEKKEFAPSTIRMYISAIISFYQAFDIQVPDIKLPDGDIGLEANQGRLLKKEEIQAMLNVANARDKALINLLALSGMSQKEARNLTIKKFLDSASEAIGKEINNVDQLFNYEDLLLNEILTLNIVRSKVNYRYQTFISPEVTRAIITYLKERKNNRNPKRHIININNKLFITKDGDTMSRSGVGTAIKRVGYLAGFKSPEGAYCYWRPHSLRKYFISTIINSIGDHILADYLAGHKIDKVKRTYWLFGPETLKKKYLEALPYLSIEEVTVKDIFSPEFNEIKSENADLRGELEEIRSDVANLGPLAKIIDKPNVRRVIEYELSKEL